MARSGAQINEKIPEDGALALEDKVPASKNRAPVPENGAPALKNGALVSENRAMEPGNKPVLGNDRFDGKGPDCFFLQNAFTSSSFLVLCFCALAYFFQNYSIFKLLTLISGDFFSFLL